MGQVGESAAGPFMSTTGGPTLRRPAGWTQKLPRAAAESGWRLPYFLAFFSFSTIRALTSFFTSATGSGSPIGNWIVPLEVL